jgi:hypothetical protein
MVQSIYAPELAAYSTGDVVIGAASFGGLSLPGERGRARQSAQQRRRRTRSKKRTASIRPVGHPSSARRLFGTCPASYSLRALNRDLVSASPHPVPARRAWGSARRRGDPRGRRWSSGVEILHLGPTGYRLEGVHPGDRLTIIGRVERSDPTRMTADLVPWRGDLESWRASYRPRIEDAATTPPSCTSTTTPALTAAPTPNQIAPIPRFISRTSTRKQVPRTRTSPAEVRTVNGVPGSTRQKALPFACSTCAAPPGSTRHESDVPASATTTARSPRERVVRSRPGSRPSRRGDSSRAPARRGRPRPPPRRTSAASGMGPPRPAPGPQNRPVARERARRGAHGARRRRARGRRRRSWHVLLSKRLAAPRVPAPVGSSRCRAQCRARRRCRGRRSHGRHAARGSLASLREAPPWPAPRVARGRAPRATDHRPAPWVLRVRRGAGRARARAARRCRYASRW